jgi:hypothetical protein
MSLTAKELLPLLRKNLILAVCIGLSLVLLAIIYLRSGLSADQQAELDQKSSEGKRYHANLLNAAQLTGELQAVVDANRLIKERAINPADLARNLQYFYRIEAETGIKYTDLRQMGGSGAPAVGAKKSSTIYAPVNYTISLQGDFAKTINFLRSLERGGHFYRLNGLVASGTNSEITLNLSVDLLGQP